MYGKYSLPNMIQAYNQNKDLIHAHLNGLSIEKYGNNVSNIAPDTVLGLGIGSFVLLFFISLAIWIWAVVVLIKYWSKMPLWAAIISLIAIFTGVGGPILTLILVYATKTA